MPDQPSHSTSDLGVVSTAVEHSSPSPEGLSWFDDNITRVPSEAGAAACDARVWAAYLQHRRMVRDQLAAALTSSDASRDGAAYADGEASADAHGDRPCGDQRSIIAGANADSGVLQQSQFTGPEPCAELTDDISHDVPQAAPTQLLVSDCTELDTGPVPLLCLEIEPEQEPAPELHLEAEPEAVPELSDSDRLSTDGNAEVHSSQPILSRDGTAPSIQPPSAENNQIADSDRPLPAPVSAGRADAAPRPEPVAAIPIEPALASLASVRASLAARPAAGADRSHPAPQPSDDIRAIALAGATNPIAAATHRNVPPPNSETGLPLFMTARPTRAAPAKDPARPQHTAATAALNGIAERRPSRHLPTASIAATAFGLAVVGSFHILLRPFAEPPSPGETGFNAGIGFSLGGDPAAASIATGDAGHWQLARVAAYSAEANDISRYALSENASPAGAAVAVGAHAGSEHRALPEPSLVQRPQRAARPPGRHLRDGNVVAQAAPPPSSGSSSVPPGSPAQATPQRPRPADPPVTSEGLPLMRPVLPANAPPPAQVTPRAQVPLSVREASPDPASRPRPAAAVAEPVVRTVIPAAKPAYPTGSSEVIKSTSKPPAADPTAARPRPTASADVRSGRTRAPRPRAPAETQDYAANCSWALPCYGQSAEDEFDFGWFFSSLFEPEPAPEPAARSRRHRRAATARAENTNEIVMRNIMNTH